MAVSSSPTPRVTIRFGGAAMTVSPMAWRIVRGKTPRAASVPYQSYGVTAAAMVSASGESISFGRLTPPGSWTFRGADLGLPQELSVVATSAATTISRMERRSERMEEERPSMEARVGPLMLQRSLACRFRGVRSASGHRSLRRSIAASSEAGSS
jgi:hypothetical protein